MKGRVRQRLGWSGGQRCCRGGSNPQEGPDLRGQGKMGPHTPRSPLEEGGLRESVVTVGKE